MGFDPHPQMFGYEPEYQITNVIWGAFSREERMQAYFDTPLELLRVRIESAFENDYDVDNPTGLFADCLVNIARTVKRMETVLNSWRERQFRTNRKSARGRSSCRRAFCCTGI